MPMGSLRLVILCTFVFRYLQISAIYSKEQGFAMAFWRIMQAFTVENQTATTSGDRGAAALLGLPPSTLYGKMKKLGIKLP